MISERDWKRWENEAKERSPRREEKIGISVYPIPIPFQYGPTRLERKVKPTMLDHLKKYAALHATWICAVAALLGQVTHDYLTQHPNATAAGFFGALGWAIITFLMKSPRQ